MTEPIFGQCRGCGKEILWIKNENGKPEPFDLKVSRALRREKTFTGGHLEPEIIAAHLPHFVTCPQAATFHKSTKKENK